MPDKIPIENLLIDSGYLTPKQLERAMRLKQGRPECTIEEILTEFGYVTEAALRSGQGPYGGGAFWPTQG